MHDVSFGFFPAAQQRPMVAGDENPRCRRSNDLLSPAGDGGFSRPGGGSAPFAPPHPGGFAKPSPPAPFGRRSAATNPRWFRRVFIPWLCRPPLELHARPDK